MAVSMQSTESGGVVNFSVGDTLTVNGKIVAQGLVTPDAGVHYVDFASKQKIDWSAWRGATTYTYTAPSDGVLSLIIGTNGSGYHPGLTVTINGVKVFEDLSLTESSRRYEFTSLPVKANDTFTGVINNNHNAGLFFIGEFFTYR